MGTISVIASFIGVLILSVVVMQVLIARSTSVAGKDVIYLVTAERSDSCRSESKTILYLGTDEEVAFAMNPRETDEGAKSLSLQVWDEGEHLITFSKDDEEWKIFYVSP